MKEYLLIDSIAGKPLPVWAFMIIAVVAIIATTIQMRKRPDNALTYYNSGKMKFKRGDINGAQADFKKAIELNPALRKIIEAKGYPID
jgi:tetratricopeptide (TPR) repeat protein